MTTKALDEALASAFERHRPSLMGLAYRMLGSIAEAQDIAQETFLRFRRAVGQNQTEVKNVGAFLHTVAARLCLDHIKSSQSRREAYVGTWLPEPLVEDVSAFDPATSRAEVLHDVSYALLLTLDRLTPTERAAFLLHDVFDLSFSEVAEAISQEEATCRQLAARARQRLLALGPRFTPPPASSLAFVPSTHRLGLPSVPCGSTACQASCLTVKASWTRSWRFSSIPPGRSRRSTSPGIPKSSRTPRFTLAAPRSTLAVPHRCRSRARNYRHP